jgi:hypothetical protein
MGLKKAAINLPHELKKTAIGLGHVAKDVAHFLITPRHVEFAIKLVLSIYGLYTPVFITLEVLQLLGITDILIEMYGHILIYRKRHK